MIVEGDVVTLMEGSSVKRPVQLKRNARSMRGNSGSQGYINKENTHSSRLSQAAQIARPISCSRRKCTLIYTGPDPNCVASAFEQIGNYRYAPNESVVVHQYLYITLRLRYSAIARQKFLVERNLHILIIKLEYDASS